MQKRFDYELEKAMDSAVMCLSMAFAKSGRNRKPVIMHSIRVGMCLFDQGYSKEIVLAGLLHDILEDTDFPLHALQEQFGSAVADMVLAATFDCAIPDKRERNQDVFRRCKTLGFDALTVKCADILDNIDYFVPTPGDEELDAMLMEKYRDFLGIAEDVLAEQPIFLHLQDKVRQAEELMAAFTAE